MFITLLSPRQSDVQPNRRQSHPPRPAVWLQSGPCGASAAKSSHDVTKLACSVFYIADQTRTDGKSSSVGTCCCHNTAGMGNLNWFPPDSNLATTDLGDSGQLKSIMCFSWSVMKAQCWPYLTIQYFFSWVCSYLSAYLHGVNPWGLREEIKHPAWQTENLQ